MTPSPAPPGPAVWVVGVDASDDEVVRERLTHGDDPTALLRRSGWSVVGPRTVLGQADPHEITVVLGVTAGAVAAPTVEVTPRDEGLVVGKDEDAVVVQRVAVYAVVRSDRGVLLTQMSARTNSPGLWGLAGGGLDPSELPEAAVHREVWEESGQQVAGLSPVLVTTNHWVGRAPSGRLEDFHAVRVVYDAWCAEPTDPVVHDVGGTTQVSAWFTPDELSALPLVTSWSEVLPRLLNGLTPDGG